VVPQRWPPKNKPENRGAFFGSQKRLLNHHLHHAKHHNFAIKTPRPKNTFPKTTLKKAPKDAKKPRATAGAFF
jgi:hypothetical protein